MKLAPGPGPVRIAANLADVRARIGAAAQSAGRVRDSVTLVAVSKGFGAEAIEAALAAGQRDFGENRVQEAQGKWLPFKAAYPDLRLHLIGPLQTNKVDAALALFDVVHTLDRARLAQEIRRRSAFSKTLFVQINTGEELQKSGVFPADADAFIARCRDDGLSIGGAMCIPPVDEEPSLHFALLAKIAKRNGLGALSMGMSADYESAIAFGATHVRVGSAIFGARSVISDGRPSPL